MANRVVAYVQLIGVKLVLKEVIVAVAVTVKSVGKRVIAGVNKIW